MTGEKKQVQKTLCDDRVVASILPIRHPSQYTRDWKDILLSVFAVWFLFVPALLFSGKNTPSQPPQIAVYGLSLVTLQSLWAVLSLLIFQGLRSPREKDDGRQNKRAYSRRIWFHTYRGINLTIIAALFFLAGARWLRLFAERASAFSLVLGFYVLLLVWSVLQRRLLLRWAVEGLPRWLKRFLFGSVATGAGIGTGIGIILGRYGPHSIVELTVGLIAFGFALVGVPRAVYDLYVAYLHWQAWRGEKAKP